MKITPMRGAAVVLGGVLIAPFLAGCAKEAQGGDPTQRAQAAASRVEAAAGRAESAANRAEAAAQRAEGVALRAEAAAEKAMSMAPKRRAKVAKAPKPAESAERPGMPTGMKEPQATAQPQGQQPQTAQGRGAEPRQQTATYRAVPLNEAESSSSQGGGTMGIPQGESGGGAAGMR
jgi:hypothetical protein